MAEEWNKGCPAFQHSIIPVFQFIPTLLRQGNTKNIGFLGLEEGSMEIYE
jgi:hypothetical protein